MRSLDIAGTGMQAQQTNVEVISNNIANMTTTGFKRRRAEFQDLIYQNLRRASGPTARTPAQSCRPARR
jgi:flagellar basal-body rod protein FlgG